MKRILSLILLILILVPFVSCAKDTEDTVITTTVGDTTTASVEKEFLLNAKFKIIRSEFITDSTIVEAMNYLRDAVDDSCGFKLFLSDDWYRESAGLVPNEYEILIGRTNRPQSDEAYDSLKENDYVYTVNSENVISICGGNSDSTLEAVKKFCLDVFGYDGKKASVKNPTLKVGTNYRYNAEYDFDDVKISGIDIKNFVVAVRDKKYVQYTVPLVSALAKYNGYNIKVKEISELDEANDKNIIFLGAADKDGSHASNVNSNSYFVTHKNEGGNLSVILDTTDVKVYATAIQRFISEINAEKNGKTVNITLPDNEILGYSFEKDIPQWILKEEKETAVVDGVTYIYQKYVDENNKPYKAYILKIDPKKAYLYMGSTNDGYDYSLDGISKQNVLAHMNAAKANGVVPVAGVNADFFAISGDYHPSGLAIKEGKQIAVVGSRPWCGYTYDGEFVCGQSHQYAAYKDKLRTAVGASDLIVSNGVPYELDLGTAFSDTAHPRTLAGVAEDGTIILAVVDGRQASVSNGAPLARCALLMISHRAKEAVNLDGGGSSCMLVQLSGAYKTVNSPSDGSLRKVYNSLLVIPKS